MAHEEKRAWIMLVSSVAWYAAYVAIILGRSGETRLAAVDYRSALLWSVGGSIVTTIVASIVVAIVSPRDAGKKDQRDKEIARISDNIGQSFLVVGGLAALILAMSEANHFWIANAIYLGFTLSAILGSVAKVIAYRQGFQQW